MCNTNNGDRVVAICPMMMDATGFFYAEIQLVEVVEVLKWSFDYVQVGIGNCLD